MASTPMKISNISEKNEGGRPLAPRDANPIDEPADISVRDPTTKAMESAVGNDPDLVLVINKRSPLLGSHQIRVAALAHH
jgi:hypothetical protein